jgi:hypothetical protein
VILLILAKALAQVSVMVLDKVISPMVLAMA